MQVKNIAATVGHNKTTTRKRLANSKQKILIPTIFAESPVLITLQYDVLNGALSLPVSSKPQFQTESYMTWGFRYWDQTIDKLTVSFSSKFVDLIPVYQNKTTKNKIRVMFTKKKPDKSYFAYVTLNRNWACPVKKHFTSESEYEETYMFVEATPILCNIGGGSSLFSQFYSVPVFTITVLRFVADMNLMDGAGGRQPTTRVR